MKKIVYKTQGTMLVPGPSGGLIPRKFEADAEAPYTEENLAEAEARALPGSLQILSHEDSSQIPVSAEPLLGITLKDRATGKLYELYIENGKVMKEVL